MRSTDFIYTILCSCERDSIKFINVSSNSVHYSGVSRGGLRGGPSHTFKWLLKVCASKGVVRVDLKNHGRGGGGSGQPEKTLDTTLH